MTKAERTVKRWVRRLRYRQLRATLWKRRHTYRRKRLTVWKRRGDQRKIDKWEHLSEVASAKLHYWRTKRNFAQRVVSRWRRIRKRERRDNRIAGTRFTWADAKRRSWYPALPGWMKPGIEKHAKALERLNKRIDHARERHGLAKTTINILSWVRSPAKNIAVGGARYSKHMRGIATDISVQEINRLCPWKGGRAEFDRMIEDVFSNGGVGEYPAGNRHMDSRGRRARWTTW